MTLRGYAKARGVSHSTIHRAVEKRLIVLDAEGRVDPAQADATWGQLRRVREVDSEKQEAESRRNTSARVAADPAAAARVSGKDTGVCCCCGAELTDPVSIAAGIGPICAGNWGF